jgi:defect in organelle trafficking protein DotA
MRRLSCYVLAVAALLLPAFVYAQAGVDQPFSGMWQLAPPASDASVYFLGQLFGSVGGVLGSVSGQIMGQIFRAFNYGLILVAGSMLSYTVAMSVLNTAQDGQFMGQEKKGAWTILRAVGGISFLVPQAGGYSFIQIFVMWAVVQGVGLADIAWGRVLTYLESGGAVFVTQGINALDLTTVSPVVQGVIQSGACLDGVSQALDQRYRKSVADAQQVAQAGGGVTSVIQQKSYAWGAYVDGDVAGSGPLTLRFGAKDAQGLQSVCGSYLLSGDQPLDDRIAAAKLSYLKAATLELYQDQQSLARMLSDPSLANVSCDGTPSGSDAMVCKAMASSVVNMMMNFQNLMQPVVAADANATKKAQLDKLVQARQYGWIMAGSYYYTFSQIKAVAQSIGDVKKYINNAPGRPAYDYDAMKKRLNIDSAPIKKLVDNVPILLKSKQVIEIIKTLQASLQQQQAQSVKSLMGTDDKKHLMGWEAGMDVASAIAGGPIGLAVMPYVLKKVEQLVTSWNTHFLGSPESDPILNVAAFGRDMVTKGVSIWIYSSAAIFIVGVGMSALTSITGVGQGLMSSGKMFIPIVLSIVVALIVNGVVLSVYIPLIPFLLFFFTAVGWMMSVVEAIVAAPLVALGITHPEGHDLLGKAEQSLMLLLSVFIKPIAMLIGFFAATLIARVGLEMLNMGLGTVLVYDSSAGFKGGDLFQTLGFMIVYTLIVIGLINFSFSLIHLLPDKIMRWIGTSPDSYGGEQQMGAIKGGLSSGMQTIAKSGADSSITTPEGATAVGEGMYKRSQQGKGKDGAEVSDAGGEG